MKLCSICDRSKKGSKDENRSDTVPEHGYYCNYTGISQVIEADLIVKGFQRNFIDHDIIYRYLVVDANSSVFSKVQQVDCSTRL